MNYLSMLGQIGNEDVRYCDELRAWYVALGVERFNWCVHRTIDDMDFAKRYGDRVFLCDSTREQSHAEEVRQIHQWYTIIRECRDCRWLALVDNDEYIVATKPLPELLVEFEDSDALGINWLMFGSSGHLTKQFPQTESYRHRTRADYGDGSYGMGGNWHIKSIVNPMSVTRPPNDPHFLGVQTVNENHNPIVCPFSKFSGNRIRMNHYWTRSLEDWREKQVYSVAPRSMKQFEEMNVACVVQDDRPAEIHGYPELG